MRSLSMAPTLVELKRYFAKYKKGIERHENSAECIAVSPSIDTGVVEFDDFLKIVLEHRSTENVANEILTAFQHYDSQRLGYVDAKQLKYILTNTGEKLSERDGNVDVDDVVVTRFHSFIL